ncbi:MAG: PIN domain-containing protein [Acidobacteriota bacterium]
MRLFLDANVLFSAAYRAEGRAAALFDLAGSGYCTLIASPHALEEARRNLELKHAKLLPRLERLLQAVAVPQECSAENAAWPRTQMLPDKDAPILGAAAQAGADLLVTGDRTHFGRLYGRTLRGVYIATPAEALARVLAEARR